MIRRLLLLFALTTAAMAVTPTSITMSSHGSVIRVGTTLSYTVVCTYASGGPDNCAGAGGATWSSPTDALQPGNGGSFASGSVTWSATFDPHNATLFPLGPQFAIGILRVCAGGICDTGKLLAQSLSDTFYLYATPDPKFYADIQFNTLLQVNISPGATMAMGVGFLIGNTGQSFPAQFAMNYTTSDATKATVATNGLATAGSVTGNVIITATPGGNGAYGTSTSGTDFYGNAYGATGSSVLFEMTVANPTVVSHTWYVRPNGGTPYVNAGATPSGQCDGLHDADYSGTGVNQPCAMGNLRYLWTDQVTANQEKWMITGGDTVIVRQKSGGYNIGLNQRSTAFGGSVIDPINCGNPDCYMPTIPSGTSANHTKIIGENFASCRADSSKTILNVSWSSHAGLNVLDSQFVDTACFDITQVAQCAVQNFNNVCNNSSSNPVLSNNGRFGIFQSAMTGSVTYTDILIDGISTEGIRGATGGGVVANFLHIRAAPFGGIDMDDNPHGLGNISVAGGFTMNNSITEFTGCVEQHPIVLTFPYIECRDSDTGAGAPDGLGTASTTGVWSFDHDIWRYNFQDGLDLLHAFMQVLNVTNSQSYGNDGNQYKIGAADTSVLFQNNTALANCQRIDQPIGDMPSAAIISGVNYCRAGGGPVVMQFSAFGTYLVQQNTINGYGDTNMSYACSAGSSNCSTATTALQNNVMLMMQDSSFNGNVLSATFCALDPSTTDCNHSLSLYPANQGWGTRSNNLYYNTRACPLALTTAETCNTVNPLFSGQPSLAITFATESSLDGFQSPVPATISSPTYHGGTTYAGIPSTDLNGVATTSPPVMGAMNLPGSVTLTSITVLPNPGSVVTSSTINFQTSSFCTFSDSSTIAAGSTGCVVVWTDTGAHSTINSSTGVATGVSAGSDTITATLSPATPGTATLNVTTTPPPSTGTVAIGVRLTGVKIQ